MSSFRSAMYLISASVTLEVGSGATGSGGGEGVTGLAVGRASLGWVVFSGRDSTFTEVGLACEREVILTVTAAAMTTHAQNTASISTVFFTPGRIRLTPTRGKSTVDQGWLSRLSPSNPAHHNPEKRPFVSCSFISISLCKLKSRKKPRTSIGAFT